MTWDAASAQMQCPYCGHRQQVQGSGPGAQERSLAHGMAVSAGARPTGAEASADPGGQGGDATGYGMATRSLRCETCGAAISFAGIELAKSCDFCGSPHVREQETRADLIRPESLVPFLVEQGQATNEFQKWLGSNWFRPGDLKKRAKVGAVSGVYIPYWTFDAHVFSQWRAEAGYYYYTTETYTTQENGQTVTKTRQVRHTRWEPAAGHRSDHYDDVLVVASQGVDEKLANKLATFDTSRLQPYDPRFLAGWRAEEYAVAIDEAWPKAQGRIESSQQGRCSSDVPGDTQRFLQVHNSFSGQSYKHILLPLWIASYRYKEKSYRFLINGQTGEVSGEAPLSVWRILFAIVVAISVIYGLFRVMQ